MTQRETGLGRHLIEAARSERPPASLEQRLLQLDPEAASRTSTRPVRQFAPASGARLASRARAPLGVGLLAVLGVASLALGAWSVAARGPAPTISAERRPASGELPASASGADANGPTASGPLALAPEPRPAEQEPALPPPSVRTPRPPASASSPPARKAPSLGARHGSSEQTSTEKRAPALGGALDASGGAGPPFASASPGTLAVELTLLTEARAALRSGAGQRALVLLDQYDARRSNPSLDAEAALLRIESLSMLGERERAAQLAERFVREHPDDALADRARRFMGRAPRPGRR